MKLTPSISLVGSGVLGFGLSDAYDCHVYWVDGGTEAAIIDAGGGRDPDTIRNNAAKDGHDVSKLRYVLLTHYHADHAGGAAGWRKNANVQVICAHDAADAMERGDERAISLDLARQHGYYPSDYRFSACPVDRRVRDGDQIRVGRWTLETLETPSQARGHLCFRGEVDGKKVIFTGDVVFYGGTIGLIATYDCNLQDYAKSVIRLGKLDIDAFFPGHGPFELRDGGKHLKAAAEKFEKMAVPRNYF
ncbi:MAG: MBL fold metallo-hydrolase [Verrucomicrobia bacterium]|nr:MBL fold metallo-hydrolase [Verrucomicrobiota bacterium]